MIWVLKHFSKVNDVLLSILHIDKPLSWSIEVYNEMYTGTYHQREYHADDERIFSG